MILMATVMLHIIEAVLLMIILKFLFRAICTLLWNFSMEVISCFIYSKLVVLTKIGLNFMALKLSVVCSFFINVTLFTGIKNTEL